MALQDLLEMTQKHDKIGISEERIEAIKPILPVAINKHMQYFRVDILNLFWPF